MVGGGGRRRAGGRVVTKSEAAFRGGDAGVFGIDAHEVDNLPTKVDQAADAAKPSLDSVIPSELSAVQVVPRMRID